MIKRFVPGLFAAVMLCLSAAMPAAVHSTALYGKVTEPNFIQKRFWIQDGNHHVAVLAAGATMRMHNRAANIYRMMGTPWARVSGQMVGNMLRASRIDIVSGPTVRLQRSTYTNRARPRFTSSDLEPGTSGYGTRRHHRSTGY